MCIQEGISNNRLVCIQWVSEEVYFGIFDGHWRKKSISPAPRKGLHKDPLNICELFLYAKIKNWLFGNSPKNQRHKTGTRFTTIVESTPQKNCQVHNSKSKLCTRMIKDKKLQTFGWGNYVPVLWCPKMRAIFHF